VRLPLLLLRLLIHARHVGGKKAATLRRARASREIITVSPRRAPIFFSRALASRARLSFSPSLPFNSVSVPFPLFRARRDAPRGSDWRTNRSLLRPGTPIRRMLDRDIKKKVLRAGCLAQLRPPRPANCLLPGLITSLCYSVNARRKPLCLPRLNSCLIYMYLYISIHAYIYIYIYAYIYAYIYIYIYAYVYASTHSHIV
jgi:hypothetical protein